MCRNIRTLHDVDPPETEDEVRAAALKYARRTSGATTQPARADETAFAPPVDAVAEASRRLRDELRTTAPPKNREIDADKARARARQRHAA